MFVAPTMDKLPYPFPQLPFGRNPVAVGKFPPSSKLIKYNQFQISENKAGKTPYVML